MSMSSLYYASQRNGMDNNITVDEFLKFDDIVVNYIDLLRKDKETNRIIKTPINELTKSDIVYILTFKGCDIV